MTPAGATDARRGASEWSTPVWLVGAVVVAAIALRVWILGSPIGRADADESVVGLMARSILDGERPMFFWGQDYGGTLEPALVAASFAVFGHSTIALKLVPVLLSGVAAVLVWRVGRRTVGEPAAALAGLVFTLFPPAFIWWSTKERGFYWAALVLALGVVLAALRIRDAAPEVRAVDVVALGFLVGLAWWTSPQSMYLVLPVLAWLAVRHAHLWRRAWPVVPAALVGALPWIRWNLQNGLSSLEEPAPWVATSYPERLGRFFTWLLPTLLGVRRPFAGGWLLGPVGVVVLSGALVALGFLAVRLLGDRAERRALEPLLVAAVAFPFLFALPKASHYVLEPRYGLMLAPVVVLLIAVPLTSMSRQVVAVSLAGALGALTVASLVDFSERNPMFVDLGPPLLGDLQATLDSADVDHVYADYWIAYPLMFETDARIVATPVDAVREAGFDQEVRAADPSTYAVFVDSQRDAALERALRGEHHRYERVETGDFAVYLLSERLPPESIPGAFGLPAGAASG